MNKDEEFNDWLCEREDGIGYSFEKENSIEELKRLFYTDRLTQYGKRKLIEYYEKQIKEQNDIIKTANIAIKDLQQKLENSIPVSLIKEKIEEYTKKIDIAQGEELLILDSKIDVLQELLENNDIREKENVNFN